MPRTVLELFDQKEVLNYLKERKYKPMLGDELFPGRKVHSLEFDLLVSGSKTPVIASIHGWDTESEIGQRKAQKKAIELALIKRKMQLSEKEVIALENPRTDAELQEKIREVYADIDNLVAGVQARVEAMRMEVVAKGTITLNENGLNASIDYGVPATHKATNVNWLSSSSDPIEDILTWYNLMEVKPKRALTSNRILNIILKNANVIKRIYGPSAERMATVGELNTYLSSLGLPTITTYDEVYKKEGSNGTYTTVRYFPENCFAMFPAEKLGETLYGPTAEEIRLTRRKDIDTSIIGNVLAMIYEDNLDPVSTWEKAVASSIPTFPYSDEIFQAQVLLTV